MVKQRKVFPPQKNKERYPRKRFTALLHHMMNSIDGKGMIDHSWTSFNIFSHSEPLWFRNDLEYPNS